MTSAARALADRFLTAVTADDPGTMADCYADEAVIEMPFAVPGLMPARLAVTREALRTRFRGGTALRRYTRVENATIHETADGSTLILEYDVHGAMAATAAPFVLRFIMVITLRDGLIAHTRDYTDPIAGARALGRLPDLLAAIG
ncbi:nuclear transport factor 2 family protein [Dactylosporangium sp. NPDC051541]|uniref:nuclear transport factor 2 family protein n=1 Tax=Dactylosporangium sp. NPDC051541 TaxID=3363977 RepID=UPI003792D3D7